MTDSPKSTAELIISAWIEAGKPRLTREISFYILLVNQYYYLNLRQHNDREKGSRGSYSPFDHLRASKKGVLTGKFTLLLSNFRIP